MANSKWFYWGILKMGMMLEGDRVEGENENFVGAKIKLFVV
jgi:hypothetical protein